MKVGFTGTRKGMTHAQKVKLTEELPLGGRDFHHGMCEGSDDEASRIALNLGYLVVGHPGMNDAGMTQVFGVRNQQHSPKPFLRRNHDIVDETDMLIATPSSRTERLRGSGTWATIRYARKQRKRVVIIYPDGSAE